MIPSDHFVRFYNEVFKFLDERNGLEAYYHEISRHQEFHCLAEFRARKLRAVQEYYLRIRKEENCNLDLTLDEHEWSFFMRQCPSLTKAIDNDAGLCRKYCCHCAGWSAPLFTRAGLYYIQDMMEPDKPQCREWVFDDYEIACQRYHEIQQEYPEARLTANFNPYN